MGWVLWPHITCHGETNRQDIHARRVSSYQNVDGAKKEVNLLKSKGYNAYFEKVLIPDKGVWYRVLS
jgi:cell division septation protein DedD